MKRCFGASAACLVSSLAFTANAQQLGMQGDAIFSADRLFGVRGEHSEYDFPEPAPDIELDQTVVAFGWTRTAVVYNVPRFAFDYLVIDKVSVGGALGFSSASGDADTSGFLFHPRAGYLHMFGSVLGIWPRGGFTYHSSNLDGVASESALSINLEAMFPIVIVPHFGVLVGFAFDRSITGTFDPEQGPEADLVYQSIGLQVGLFGWI